MIPGEIERFHDRCSDLMRELPDALTALPDRPRAFSEGSYVKPLLVRRSSVA